MRSAALCAKSFHSPRRGAPHACDEFSATTNHGRKPMRPHLRAIPGFVFVLMFAAFRFSTAADFDAKLLDAAEKGDFSTISVLLEAGADSNAGAPLSFAASNGHIGAISVLLDAGADANETGGRAFSPLHFSALAEHAEAVDALLDAGADPNVEGDFSPTTPLHWEAQMGHVRAIAVLLRAGAGADAHAKDTSGRVPFELVMPPGPISRFPISSSCFCNDSRSSDATGRLTKMPIRLFSMRYVSANAAASTASFSFAPAGSGTP